MNMREGADQKAQALEQYVHTHVQAPLPTCKDKACPDILHVCITGSE